MKHAPALAADYSAIRLQRLPAVRAALADISRTTIADRVGRGLLPKPVKVGHSIAWPSNEIDAVVAAHVRGASESEIAALVRALHERRGSIGQNPTNEQRQAA
jgi:prophage regulatory protein